MPRPASGHVVERQTAAGRVYALRFRAYGSRRYLTLGSRDEGWTRAKAELELQNVLADVRRGIWREAELPQPAPAAGHEITFHDFASDWYEEIAPSLRPSTQQDYLWALSYHLLPFFHCHRLPQITVAEVDRYRAAKVREGRLNATSINKTLTRLGQILDVADERELIPRNPMSVNRRRRKLRAPTPQRTYIDQAADIEALLAAAGELDRQARADQDTPRRAILATLILSGLHIGELLELRWRDVNLAAGRFRVGHSKTAAGIREVELLPALRDELGHLKAARSPNPDDLVFGTSAARPQSRSNVRQRVLNRSVDRANERLVLPAASTVAVRRRGSGAGRFGVGRDGRVARRGPVG